MTNIARTTVAELLAQSTAAAPDTVAMVAHTGRFTTYRALSERVSGLAAQFGAAAPARDIRPRIGIVMPNGVDLAATLLAAAIAGEATPFNPALTAAEFERYFEQTAISFLVVAEGDDTPAATVAARMGIPLLRLSEGGGIVGAAADGAVPVPAPDATAMVLMTSGSTGVPKIVPLSHRNVCRSAADVARSVALAPQDRCLVMWQQFHIGGLVDLLLAPLQAGGTLIVTPGFDAALFFELLEREAPTWFQAVPTTLGALAQHAERHGLTPRGSSLRFVRSVAAALTPQLQTRVADLFGVPVVRTLGMTEASPLITSTALPPARDKIGSVGRPSGPELRVFGPAMEVLEPGQAGEIAIRGENVFAGYENNPEANAAAFRDGWFFTGDNGYLDADGDLFLTGRSKEQINRGGYKIMPSEVEEALSRHPAVHEAAVFGVPHPTLGEDVAAAVSLKPDAPADAAALRAHLSGLLAANKVPGRIAILEDLPRNPVGKLDRLALAQRAMDEAASAVAQQGPRDAMERFLVTLWTRELAVPEVGIHQDFAMVGGDSLSALRILVAMETVFGRPVPDDMIAEFNTIAATAAALTQAGFVLPDADAGSAADTAERALGQVATGTEDLAGVGAFAGAIRDARTKTDLDAALEGLTVYATPATIRSVLLDTDAATVAQPASAAFRFLLRRQFRQTADAITAEIDASRPASDGWQRETLSPGAMRFFDPSHPAWSKTLIVGFTGKLMRLQLPSYRVLLHLDPARFDLMLLRDGSHKLFADGLPGMGDDLGDLGAWLDDFAVTGGYARRIALGTSGGGLAAIHTALAHGWDRAVAASPPSPAQHPDLGTRLQQLAARPDDDLAEVIVSNARNDRDVPPAQELLALFPHARHDFHPEFTSHNVLNSAHRAGTLGALFASWFD